MKHTREFYVLMAITIAIPVLMLLGMLAFSMSLDIVLDHGNSTVNDTTATFVMKSKSSTQFVGGTHIAGVWYYMNRTDLDAMEYGRTYSCNVTRNEWFDLNNTLSGCVRL